MSTLLERLGRTARRGSKPRCHFLTHGSSASVAARLTALTMPIGQRAPLAIVTSRDQWMPQGFDVLTEAELPKATRLVDRRIADTLLRWWLPQGTAQARTPSFDIASTCTIDGRRGLILVEAKAHVGELEGEARAKPLADTASQGSRINHATIGEAIDQARAGLQAATGMDWHIGRDNHYQMSNRFAWGWKLAQLGIPVVLVYLGFTGADDMTQGSELPFADEEGWNTAVRRHSALLFPDQVWNTTLEVNGVAFIPLIHALELSLQEAAA
jgi:hypothetical protein